MARPPSKQDICERIYEWAFRDAQRELRECFPLTRRIRGENANHYVRFFSQLRSQGLIAASDALVKRMNQPLLLKKNPTLTNRETEFVESYLNFGQVIGPGGFRMIVADPERAGVVRTRDKRKILKNLIRERFGRGFGESKRLSAVEWLYELDLGTIRIQTWLDVGGRSSLTYHHLIADSSGQPIRAHLGILQWLGAASMTRWEQLRTEELFDAADCVRDLSRHFICEMRNLFR